MIRHKWATPKLLLSRAFEKLKNQFGNERIVLDVADFVFLEDLDHEYVEDYMKKLFE